MNIIHKEKYLLQHNMKCVGPFDELTKNIPTFPVSSTAHFNIFQLAVLISQPASSLFGFIHITIIHLTTGICFQLYTIGPAPNGSQVKLVTIACEAFNGFRDRFVP